MTPFIVAEMSANHLGSLDRALRIVQAAADAGADAIKVQTWVTGSMCVSDYVLDHGPWKGRRLKSLYAEAHLPWGWHEPIFKKARDLGLEPFSAAFDMESVDFLESLGVKRHKVASFEITDLPLIRYMASKGKPMILSMGMASGDDMYAARTALELSDYSDVLLLRCVSAYPAPLGSLRLRYQVDADKWGLSDHTLGIGASVAAVAQGATYIEKHLTLNRADGGLDSHFSVEPHEFKAMAQACREAWEATWGDAEAHESKELRRSLWVVRDIAPGDRLELGVNVRSARPALGAHPDAITPRRGQLAYATTPLRSGVPLATSDIWWADA